MLERIVPFSRKLAAIELWTVSLVVASSFVSSRLLPAAFIISIMFCLVRWLAYRRISQQTPADWVIILLILMIPVTIQATAFPETTWPQVYRLLSGIALFYAIVNWATNPGRLRWLGMAVIGTGLILASSSIIIVNWPVDKFSAFLTPVYNHFSVLSGDPVNPNVMAGSLVILLPIPLGFILFYWSQMSRILRSMATVATLSMVVVLGLTLSRGAWTAFGMVLVILVILRWKRGWIFVAAGLLTGVGIVSWLGITPTINAIFSNTTLGGMDGRYEVWSRALYMIQDFTFTGIGMGSFGNVADTLYPFYAIAPGRIPHAHNLFLQIAVDMGLPGLITWLSIFFTIGFISWKIYQIGRSTGDKLAMAIGSALLCSQVALASHGLTDAVTWGMVRSAPIIWALWGIAASGWNIYRGYYIYPALD
jgi:putative inorganic carbon (HCO3(-)) transporter